MEKLTPQEKEEKKALKKAKAVSYIKAATNRDKQRTVTYLAYIGCVAVSVLASSLSIIFGIQESFSFNRFVTNLCFNIAFAVLALVLSWRDGEMANENRESGLLYEMKQLFKRAVKLIIDTESFRQWNDILYDKMKKEFIRDSLAVIDINDYEYMYISEDDLKKLKTQDLENVKYLDPEDKKEKTIALYQISNYKYETIKNFRDGKFKFPKLSYTYFKSASKGNSYFKFANEERKNKNIKVFALVYRVLMILIFSTIFALAIINPTQSDAKQIVFDTITRVFNMVSSMFMGYSLARDEAKREASSLEFKANTINDYDVELQTGLFVPLGRDEIIQKRIQTIRDKRIAEMKEEDKKPVIEEKPKEPETEFIEVEMTEEEIQAYKKDTD